MRVSPGGDTLSYGTKAEILAAVGPWLQVEKDDYANPDTDSTTRNLEQAYTARRPSSPRRRAPAASPPSASVLMLAATSPDDAGGRADEEGHVDDGTSIFTIYFWMLTPAPAG